MPEIGTFDVITADLPFGMQISKGEDLEKLYKTFVDYSGKILAKNGVLVAYTTESELLQKILKQSKFQVEKTLELKVSTVVGAYIYPKIFVCRLKK